MKKVFIIIFILLMCSGCLFDKYTKVEKPETDISDEIVFSDKELEKIEEELEYYYKNIDDVDIEVAGKVIYMEVEYEDNTAKEDALKDCEGYITFFDSKMIYEYDLNMTLDGNNWYVTTNYANGTLIIKDK